MSSTITFILIVFVVPIFFLMVYLDRQSKSQGKARSKTRSLNNTQQPYFDNSTNFKNLDITKTEMVEMIKKNQKESKIKV